jgi:hypothetical protein
MDASGAVTIASKIGLGLVVVFIAVTVFKRTSPLAYLAERGAMRRCVGLVQEDLDQIIPEQSPTVAGCTGPVQSAVCAVETSLGDARKTAPVSDWDCTKRHMPDGLGGEFIKSFVTTPEGGLTAGGPKLAQDFLDGIRYVAVRVAERHSLLQGQ